MPGKVRFDLAVDFHDEFREKSKLNQKLFHRNSIELLKSNKITTKLKMMIFIFINSTQHLLSANKNCEFVSTNILKKVNKQ